jgi:tripartite-type tricarboxylate transporter receptor subunit TctC
MKRALLAAFALALPVAIAAAPKPAAAAWPEKPIKAVVPFGPGGTSDLLARLMQQAIEEQKLLPQPVTVVNVKGHFSIGSIQVKNAPPDGYNFLVIQLALLSGEVVDPSKGVSYRDFEPVALTGGFCLHHVVREDAPWKTLADLVAEAKAKPNTILFGVNIGALNHMGGGYLERATGAKFRFVQIGGGANNFAALKGSQTQTTMLSGSEYANFKSGGMRSLAYTGANRLQSEPNVPTAKELGLGYEFCINNYWFAPKGTPREAIDGMANALEKAMASDLVKKTQAERASTTEFLKGEAFRKHLDDTFRDVEPVAKQLVTQK